MQVNSVLGGQDFDWHFPVLFISTVSMPWWLPSLSQASEIAGQLAPFLAIVLVVLKIWFVWKESRPGVKKVEAAQELHGAMAGAFGGLAKIATKVWVPLAVVLAVFGIGAWLMSGKAHAATVPAVSASSKARKRSADDAGDDADAEDDAGGQVPGYYNAARAYIGTHEAIASGRKPNPKVQEMYPVSGYAATTDSRRVPWCAVFCNWCLKKDGIPGTGSAMARSFLKWGKRVEQPFPGCIIVIWRGKHDDGATGHVGFYAGETATHWKILGGNQGDAVKVALFPKRRNGKPVLLGFRKPNRAINSKQVAAAATQATVGAAGAGVAVHEAVSEPQPSAPVSETIEAVKAPVETISNVVPQGTKWHTYVFMALAALTVAAAVFALYERHKKAQKFGW